MAIDYGLKRTGIAVTDPLQIISTALETVETQKLMTFLNAYFATEPVDMVVVGMPKQLNNQDSEIAPQVRKFIENFEKRFPNQKITIADERFTSKLAHRAMLEGGMKKKDRRVKGNVDKISATLILQNYMESRHR